MNKSCSTSTMLYGIDEHPPVGLQLSLAFQHVFAMFGATILTPILINAAAGATVVPIPLAICTSGLGTLVYQLCTKGKSPVYLGSSFAFITPVALAYQAGGIASAMTGLAAVALIYLIFAWAVHRVGTAWIDHLLPPVVIGPMIMIIGLNLSSSAISQIGLNAGADINFRNLIAAAVTLGSAIFFMACAKGLLRVIPFLLAIAIGYVVSIPLGLVDFTPVQEAAWFSLPHFTIMFYDYMPDFSAVIQLAPIALVTIPEHIGDHKALSTIVGKDLLKSPGLSRTLLGDGLATLLAVMLGSTANTSYGENTSVVGITRVASVCVLRLAAFFAIGISCIGKVTALISTIPNPVLGGISILLYGFIGLNGAKVWIEHHLDFGFARNVIIASVMLVLGLGGAVLPISIGSFAVSFSGMSLAAIFGVILNLILPVSQDEVMQQYEYAQDQRRLEALHADPELLAKIDQQIDDPAD